MLTPAEARSIEEHGLAEIGGVLVRPIEIRGLGGTAAGEGPVLAQNGTLLGRLLGGAIDEQLSFWPRSCWRASVMRSPWACRWTTSPPEQPGWSAADEWNFFSSG